MSRNLAERQVSIVLGQRGCGKTTLTRKLAELYPRRIVFDRLQEYENGEIVSDLQSFGEAYERLCACTSFQIIFRFRFGIDTEELNDECNKILRAVYLRERDLGSMGLALVFEEIQYYASTYSINPGLFEVIHTGRHSGLALIANSQRPAAIHKALISQAHHLFVGRLFEHRDVNYLRSSIGEIAEKAKSLQPYTFIHYFGEGSEIVRL